MEISTAAPPSLNLPTNAKSPDTDQAETPPTARIQPTKSLPFTNGVLKRHAPPHLHHVPPATLPPVTYKECMKNHAAAMGGHALDGCGEFMPSPTAVAADPTSLKCAACGCHRNFHRRESPAEDHHPIPISAAPTTHVIEYHPHHRHHPPPPPYSGRSPNSQSPPPISSSYYPASAPHMLLALSGGATGGIPNSGGIDALNSPHGTSSFPHGRKRFRSKFTQTQKEKMHEFAEKLGWKMQKAGEETVADFCAAVGVERSVFKVWMHNNKNTFGKRDSNGTPRPGIPDGATNPAAGTSAAGANNGSSGNSGSHGYSKNGDATYGKGFEVPDRPGRSRDRETPEFKIPHPIPQNREGGEKKERLSHICSIRQIFAERFIINIHALQVSNDSKNDSTIRLLLTVRQVPNQERRHSFREFQFFGFFVNTKEHDGQHEEA